MTLGCTKPKEIVNKVKAVVEYFKKSTVGLTKLEIMQKQMNLPIRRPKQEYATRWNSCYEIYRIIKIKDGIISTLALLWSDLALQLQEWHIIEEVLPIMQPFYEITEEMSAEKFMTLSKVLIFAQLISRHIARALCQTQHEIVKNMLEITQNEIQVWFHELERNNLYGESTILDPRFKRKGFRTVESYNIACESLKRRIAEIRLAQDEREPDLSLPPGSSVEVANSEKNSIWDDFDCEIVRQIYKRGVY